MEQFLLSFLASCRPSFRRKATYIWFVTVLTGIMWRDDMLGMTSFIRALGLAPERYECLANFFRSSAWDGAELLARTAAWSHGQRLAVKRKYGKKIKIRQLFDDPKTPFVEGRVTLYGKPETVKLYAINLIRKPGDLIRFVLAKTKKGRIVVTSTDLEVESADAWELYALRAPIEEAFDAAKNVMGAKTGRFWTKALEPVSRRPARNAPRKCSSGKALDNTVRAHRNNVSLSLVALAFLQVFACMFGAEAVAMANFWTRTPSRATPSPRIARKAIGILLRELLHGQARGHAETIFNKIGFNPDPKRADAVA